MQHGRESRQIRHPLVATTSIGAFAAFVGVASLLGASRVEGSLERQGRSALDDAGITASVHFEGRDAVLEGTVTSADESRRAEIVVADLPGTRQVRTRLVIAAPRTPEAPPVAVADPPPAVSREPSENSSPPPTGTILFGSDEIALSADAETYLGALAEYLEKYPGRTVRIEGHTDSVGARSLNRALSARRARAVADRLVVRGVEASRLAVHGYADTRPVASNRTPAGRAANRRVQVVVEGIA